MLSKEDNELLCRVGPGTPMGDLMRQYWIPAVRSDELPAPDCPPLRVRLLGEDLIAFRVTSGAVGLVQNACPHRGASLFFGRNEEEGLRCVYHGWKFDVAGRCVDMPSEPAESNFKSKVRAKAYPCVERGGIVWAYMGPREVPPPLPQLEANMLPEGQYSIYCIFQECNYMQGWEGEMDTVHQAFLHYGSERAADIQPGTAGYYIARQRQAKFSILDTEFGTSYGAYRPAEEDTYYWRIAHQMFPFYAMIPTGTLGLEVRFRAYVPVDDEHTLMWTVTGRNGVRPGREGLRGTNQEQRAGGEPQIEWLPNSTDWYGRFRITQDPRNDFGIDRQLQKSGRSFSGIPGGARPQDMAVTWSMGPIYDRSREHLGTTDQLIIRTRRRLLAAAKALRDHGIIPPGVDNPEVYAQRSGGVILPRDADWWEATKDLRRGFVQHEGLTPLVGV
ncbi:MAG TPA: Rieske 2Fe-2S domain-containing protein [Dehalococcoidia bacterium]|nr:Rieske 2Fe-2S domain-containing protein [Dehalococcoidia bacterium]